ncbi:MAG: type I-D CRISPR-associated helicase Cas3' [Candidatus Aenigmarchaeota archaeon]|nr:type I-D CRISPR-associated helicase Cas3' [Candidatus Aenigmarchaeota archaeon]
MNNQINLQIGPRFVKEEIIDGQRIRPFQRETIEAIKKSDAKIITVEAPVGSGKSFIIRNLIQDDFFKNKPIILTYPTKILMDAQVGAMKKELEKVAVWPDDNFIEDGNNIINYSSKSIIEYLKKKEENFELNKPALLDKLFEQSWMMSEKRIIVTSPDVLHILINLKRYKSKSKSREIANKLQGCYVFFDEFHTYTNLKHFPELIENLLKTIATKIILLSATPYESEELKQIKNIYKYKNISFSNSITKTKENGKEFNYPLEMSIDIFRYTDRKQTLRRIRELIPKIEKPAAIIFDSIFRLQHLKTEIKQEFNKEFEIKEWHGLEKSQNLDLTNKTIVLGTSSIEVGIDMNFKTLITEASMWTSAIQRIGRVGRKSNGNVILFSNSAEFEPLINLNSYSRTEFEEILKKALKNPTGQEIGGLMFRGDSYNFILKDVKTKKVYTYSHNLFAMYDIDIKGYNDEWKTLDCSEKKEELRRMNINNDKIEELLLQDKIFPFWGAVQGTLKKKYDEVKIKYYKESDEEELHISSNKDYTFYG